MTRDITVLKRDGSREVLDLEKNAQGSFLCL